MASQAKSTIRMHQGAALCHVADRYPTLEECVMEAVQNGIDALAKNIEVKIDLARMSISITDNGDGVGREDFEQALSSVCQSVKKEGTLGRFGIGLIAFLGKCDYFRFISCPKGKAQGYLQWVFNSGEIISQGDFPEIKCDKLTQVYNPRIVMSKTKKGERFEVNWRTGIFVNKFDRKKIVRTISLDTLEYDIVTRYGHPMRRLGTVVKIKLIQSDGASEERLVRASTWSGVPLPEEVIDDKDAGQITFRIFQVRKRQQKNIVGVVSLGETGNPYRLPFRQFAKQAVEWLDREIVEGLSSGLFEGEILSTGVKLNANRRQFNESTSLVGLCSVIEDWWKRVGSKVYSDARDQVKTQRYEELAKRSLSVTEKLLQNRELGGILREAIKRFKVGSIGKNHTDIAKRKIVGPDDSGTAVQGSKRPGDRSGESNGDREYTPPNEERKEQIPLVVIGPSGNPRKAVTSNSLGIHIAHDEMPGVDRLWIFEQEKGQLIFNIRHPVYEAVEDNDNAQMKLMEQVLCQVLVMYSFEDQDWRATMEFFLERYHQFIPFFLMEADKLAGRGPGRRRSN